ncbi:hypothetical protein BKA69DRAFT_1052329 [Paraphysoderma sedebokerense]|nr:hypothetical protein BKA69DRAFT_1052329 [Paraphysoderma sedebokerense]
MKVSAELSNAVIMGLYQIEPDLAVPSVCICLTENEQQYYLPLRNSMLALGLEQHFNRAQARLSKYTALRLNKEEESDDNEIDDDPAKTELLARKVLVIEGELWARFKGWLKGIEGNYWEEFPFNARHYMFVKCDALVTVLKEVMSENDPHLPLSITSEDQSSYFTVVDQSADLAKSRKIVHKKKKKEEPVIEYPQPTEDDEESGDEENGYPDVSLTPKSLPTTELEQNTSIEVNQLSTPQAPVEQVAEPAKKKKSKSKSKSASASADQQDKTSEPQPFEPITPAQSEPVTPVQSEPTHEVTAPAAVETSKSKEKKSKKSKIAEAGSVANLKRKEAEPSSSSTTSQPSAQSSQAFNKSPSPPRPTAKSPQPKKKQKKNHPSPQPKQNGKHSITSSSIASSEIQTFPQNIIDLTGDIPEDLVPAEKLSALRALEAQVLVMERMKVLLKKKQELEEELSGFFKK